jgi:aspartate-semialdehyde dehydrogenase
MEVLQTFVMVHRDAVSSWTARFAWVNWAVACVFMLSGALLFQFEWRTPTLPPAQPLVVRFSSDPRVMLYFLICFAAVAWLLGFFAVGITRGEMAKEANEKKSQRKQKMSIDRNGESTVASRQNGEVQKKKVAILGGTGLVGRALALRLENHPTLCLGFLVGSPDTAGKRLKEVWERKESALRKQYGEFWETMQIPEKWNVLKVSSFDDIFSQSMPAEVLVISCVAPSLGWMEDKLIESGFNVFSISPHARTRPGVPLVVPEVNGISELQSLLKSDRSKGRLIKSPNCVSCGVCLVLDALSKSYGGLSEISITTFQSLSGRGDALYDKNLVTGNVLPLGRTEEDTNRKIREEVIRVLNEPDLRISVTAQRIPTQRGHFVDVRVKTRNPVPSEEHAAKSLESYAPFAGTAFESLPDAPKRGGPIRVSMEPKWPRPVQAVKLGMKEDDGMAVHVGQLCTDDRVFDLCLSFVVDNIARGAYGAALLTSQVYEQLSEDM